ncbi:MAG: diaminopimelate epimerase [candidate division Zixibacteria bacterium]|nr:diaminopimelate epimerase [candidate division Zixibacteria bacterium]
MNNIPFVKVESLQNDFVIVESKRNGVHWTRRRAASICDRRRGVGADGLILLGPATGGGIRFRLFNSDGSRAEWSGNGVRGAAALLTLRHLRKREFHLLTAAGCIRVSTREARSRETIVTFERPFPKVGSAGGDRPIGRGGVVRPIVVDAGNPHWVYPALTFDFLWKEIGAACQARARSTHGVNVEFVLIKSKRRIELRIFERGVGPTPSSGSGALAAFAACRLRNWIGDKIHVQSPGGIQELACDPDHRHVRLSAPARVVATGVWHSR